MGLLTSVNNLNYTLQEEKKKNALEKRQKRIEREKREELKAYKIDLEYYLKDEFQKYFSIAGSDYIYEFYNKSRKKEILESFFDTIKTIDHINNIELQLIPFKKDLELHFYNKYDTILKKAHQEQKQQEQYNIRIIAAEQEKEQEEIKTSKIDWIKTIDLIFKIIMLTILLPIALIFFIIKALLK